VERNFAADRPNQLWVADITYVPTAAGFLYLAVVLDAFSRRIVGWAIETHLRTELVLAALEMAIGQRNPSNVIHPSDQGTQYKSLAFGGRCREIGVRPSMGSVGDAYDNAMCESFFATLECELLPPQGNCASQ
jgi:putative transposase